MNSSYMSYMKSIFEPFFDRFRDKLHMDGVDTVRPRPMQKPVWR